MIFIPYRAVSELFIRGSEDPAAREGLQWGMAGCQRSCSLCSFADGIASYSYRIVYKKTPPRDESL